MDDKLKALHLNAGRKAGEARTCGKKIAYGSEATATKSAEKMNAKPKTRNVLEAYPCAFCGKWHIGREMPMDVLVAFLEGDEQEPAGESE